MTGFFEKESGSKSMMRLLAFLGFITGAVVAIWGLVLMTLLILSMMKGMVGSQESLGTILLVISGGLTLAGAGEALKVLQQRKESEESK